MIRMRKEAPAQGASHRDREMPGLSLANGEKHFLPHTCGARPAATQAALYRYPPIVVEAICCMTLDMTSEVTPTPRAAAGGW